MASYTNIKFIDDKSQQISVYIREGDLGSFEQIDRLINVFIRDKYNSWCCIDKKEADRVMQELLAIAE